MRAEHHEQGAVHLGPREALDPERARKAVDTFATELGTTCEDAATGLLDIVNENMAAALRLKTVERGLDPREFVLCAFGGAGPLHGADLARLLEIPEVVIPPAPGVTSAAGLLASNLRYDAIQSVLRPLVDIDPSTLDSNFETHEATLIGRLRDDGCPDDRTEVIRAADLRYRGQGYELTVPVTERPINRTTLTSLRAAFDRAHRDEFGHDFPEYDVELVNTRVTVHGRLFDFDSPTVEGETTEEALIETRRVWFKGDDGAVEIPTPVYRRHLLPTDVDIEGPAVVSQLDTTTLVPPGAAMRRDSTDNLRIVV